MSSKGQQLHSLTPWQRRRIVELMMDPDNDLTPALCAERMGCADEAVRRTMRAAGVWEKWRRELSPWGARQMVNDACDKFLAARGDAPANFLRFPARKARRCWANDLLEGIHAADLNP